MRNLLALALSACLAACSDETMTAQGLPPWHMWGNSQTTRLVGTGVGQGVGIQKSQLLKIAYGRPETWRWLFQVNIDSGQVQGEGDSSDLIVVMNVTTGVGRSVCTVPLGRLRFLWVNNPEGLMKFTNNVNAPPQDDTDSDPPPPNVVNTIVGQDIQVEILAQYFGTAGSTVDFTTTVLFAPQTHVRPEWFQEHFPGGEQTGR